MNGLKIHHVGYAVRDMDLSREGFKALGYVECGTVCDDIIRNVMILFMKDNENDMLIELISVLDNNTPSPVNNFIKSRSNDTIPYHICYKAEAPLNDVVEELVSKGFKVIQPASPAPAIDGKNVVFLYNKGVGIIELVE